MLLNLDMHFSYVLKYVINYEANFAVNKTQETWQSLSFSSLVWNDRLLTLF